MPFFLVYGAKAVLPTKLRNGSPRVLAFNEARERSILEENTLLLEEAHCQVAIRTTRYEQALRRYHSRIIRPRTLETGDLVLRRILSREGFHKLSLVWEGPFRVVHVSRPNAARLETDDGIQIPNAWNIQDLRKFYP